MKILFVTDLYPIEECEITTPQTLHNFVKEWIKLGHEVEVIKPNFLFNSFLRGKKFYKTGFYESGVKIFNLNYFTPFLFDVAKKIPKEIDLNSYDVVIAHMPSGIIFVNKLNLDIPLVCGVHCSDIEVLTNSFYGFYFKKQLKNAYKKAKKIACRSFVLQKKFNTIMPDCAEKTFVASSGVDVGGIVIPPYSPIISHFSLITCANLIKRKNIDKLILAVNDLVGRDCYPADIELKIIGDGKEMKRLRRLGFPAQQRQSLSRSGLLSRQQNIEFLGRLPHENVLEQMQKSDVFILPSVNETFGMVYLEAMASGCITVCTQNDGIDGIIQDGKNGFLTEPTIAGIKQTLLRIKDFDLEKIRQNSLETIKQYTPENCAKNYIDNINKE